ncbi:hypothetical protein AB1Y20_015843 [Prymnesium parvum]|uniref:Kinesin motor domain-containing protein n=1 Tax=Prymnesium parvum TaxID=97485 RepID=A0AB34JY97_PRYPA
MVSEETQRLATSIMRIRELRALGALTEDEMHRQFHLLITPNESVRSVPPRPTDFPPAPRNTKAVTPPSKAHEPSVSPSLGTSHGEGLPLGEDTGTGWLDDFERLEHKLLRHSPLKPSPATAAAESALLQLSSACASQRGNGARNVPSYPPVPSEGLAPPASRRGASWTITGEESDALLSDVPLGPRHHLANAENASSPTDTTCGGRMNLDKRRCRQLHVASFKAAIAARRSELARGGERCPHPMPPSLLEVALAASGTRASVSAWVRKRPLLPAELARGEFDAVEAHEASGTLTTHTCLMKPDLRRMYIRHATFRPLGGVFDESASSEKVYTTVVRPLVEKALHGGCGSLFMYGQTGSGKTFTMNATHELLAAHLFDEVGVGSVQATLIEVMGRRCIDLSSRERYECQLLQAPGGPVTVDGATVLSLHSATQMQTLLRRAMALRTTQRTGVNETSSRSHAIIHLAIGGARGGELTLVDCAGSEWSADSDKHCAKRRKEGAEINSSLHALKQCVRMFAERQRSGGKGHIPFRDSLLTRLLSRSFEGKNCALSMVGCVSPGANDCEHSTSTMRTIMELSATQGKECIQTTQQVPRVKEGSSAGENAPLQRVPTKRPGAWEINWAKLEAP